MYPKSEVMPLKIISFNLKRDAPLARKHNWAQRKEAATQLIRSSNALVIGVQELMPQMRRDVEELLAEDYTVAGFGRYYGVKKNHDEHSDIFVNKHLARLCYCKTFWLSNYPEQYGSKALLAFFPRICTVAEVRILATGQKIRVFNTHLDHISGPARNLAVRIILEYMQRYNEREQLPMILMGDLNANYNSRAVRILRENLHEYSFQLTDVYTQFNEKDLTNTYHHFAGTYKPGKSPIDYIFVSDEFEVLESHVYTQTVDGRYPSDHFPLVSTVQLQVPSKEILLNKPLV